MEEQIAACCGGDPVRASVGVELLGAAVGTGTVVDVDKAFR